MIPITKGAITMLCLTHNNSGEGKSDKVKVNTLFTIICRERAVTLKYFEHGM